MTLYGIYHKSADGIVTLCESSGANYYEAAFHNLESANGYAMQCNDQFKSQSYFAAPLADGIVAHWIADAPSEVVKQSALAKFLAHNPTVLAKFGGFTIYEHPLRGDEVPVYMATPKGKLINTGFYDLGDFDLALCLELVGE